MQPQQALQMAGGLSPEDRAIIEQMMAEHGQMPQPPPQAPPGLQNGMQNAQMAAQMGGQPTPAMNMAPQPPPDVATPAEGRIGLGADALAQAQGGPSAADREALKDPLMAMLLQAPPKAKGGPGIALSPVHRAGL